MKAPVIPTERFILRPFKESDAQLWQIWDVDIEVQSYLPEPLNKEQDIREQYKFIRECEEEEDGLYWSIESKEGITIGTVALTAINEHHKLAELGIVIGNKDYWGKGVATEVIGTVIDHAFSSLTIERVSAEIESANIAIAKVLEKVGFLHDGTFLAARVKDNQRIDVKHYGILKQ